MIQKIHPHGHTAKLRVFVTSVLSATMLLACSLPAWSAGVNAYTTKIDAKLKSLYGSSVTTISGTLPQLEAATQALILSDTTNAANYTYGALYLRTTNVTDAPAFADYLANGLSAAMKGAIGQGAVQGAPGASGSLAAILRSGTTGGAITDTVTFAKQLIKRVTKNGDACGQVAEEVSKTYPVITVPTQFANDLRLPLAVAMIKTAPSSTSSITQGIGLTMNLDLITTPMPYADRERLAQFAFNLAVRIAPDKAGPAAVGFVTNAQQVAPRVINGMLTGNPKINANTLVQSVAHMDAVDAEEVVEIAAALAFGPGVDSASPIVTDTNAYPFGPSNTPSPLGTTWLTTSNAKHASKISAILAAELAGKPGGVSMVGGMTSIFANKLASFGSTTADQKMILDVTKQSATAASKAAPGNSLAIAADVSTTVSSAVFTAYGTDPTASIYVSLISDMVKLAGPSNIAGVVTAVTTGLANPAFTWSYLNPSEVPQTNL